MIDKNKSEEIRIRYRYRKLILSGKVKLSIENASRLIGPDCAYHLYSNAERKTNRRKKQP